MVPRLTIRGRLTLWYSALFAVTGAAVLALIYLLVRRAVFAASDSVETYLAGGNDSMVQYWQFQFVTAKTQADALHAIFLQTGVGSGARSRASGCSSPTRRTSCAPR